MNSTAEGNPKVDATRLSAERAALALLDYCKNENWASYDPYDGLSSRFLTGLPFSRSWVFRLLITQGLKRSPANLKLFILVPNEGRKPQGVCPVLP
jgi:hypothetical protein